MNAHTPPSHMQEEDYKPHLHYILENCDLLTKYKISQDWYPDLFYVSQSSLSLCINSELFISAELQFVFEVKDFTPLL